jgi:hypothetical protein
MNRALLLCLLLIACRDSPPASAPPPSPGAASLSRAVAALLATADLDRAVATMALDRDAFARVLVAPYRRLHAAYAGHFATEAPSFAAELQALAPRGSSPKIRIRRHYAGDATLSLPQGRVRWALPVQAESWLVELDGKVIDTVWVRDHDRWYLLLGLDEAALEVLAAAAPACASVARRAGAVGVCNDAVWVALDAALRDEPERLARACDRASHFCR